MLARRSSCGVRLKRNGGCRGEHHAAGKRVYARLMETVTSFCQQGTVRLGCLGQMAKGILNRSLNRLVRPGEDPAIG
jgi:hypothetical protein